MSETAECELIRILTRRRRPRILYHYSSPAGFIGIVQSKSIWATNVRFLNDSTEYRFALSLARTLIEGRLARARNRFDLGLYTVLNEKLTREPAVDVCVSSFTENGDQLSQWRAYCPSMGGYAIGFTSNALLEPNENERNSFLAACIYDGASQNRLIELVFDSVAQYAEQNRRQDVPHDRVFKECFKLLGRLIPIAAPFLKDSSFAEEQEWRLVHLNMSVERAPRFREGLSTIIPYYEHVFARQNGTAPIEEVIIGPTPSPELARDAAQALLVACGLPRASVKSSVIPYRTW